MPRTPIKKRPTPVGPSTTGLSQGYGEAVSSGYFNPGGGGDAMHKVNHATHMRMQKIGQSIGGGAHHLFTGLLGPSEADIERESKYVGQMAYYNAKLKRRGK